jgi:hypothetical protein
VYKIVFDVYPACRVTDVRFSGPLFDVMGKNGDDVTFIKYPKRKYSCFTDRNTDKIVVKTCKVGAPTTFWFEPDFVSNRFEVPKETLESRIRAQPTDMELVVPGEEPTVLPVHSFVVRASTEFFDNAAKFNGSSRIALCDKFSVDAWKMAVNYMYSPVIESTCIPDIQDLMMIGDMYQIKSLVLSGAIRLRNFVNDNVTVNALAYVLSIMSLGCHFVARHDDSIEKEMVELCQACMYLIVNKAEDLMQDREFLKAFNEIIPMLEEMEGVLHLRNAGLEEFDRRPVMILGKRKWNY